MGEFTLTIRFDKHAHAPHAHRAFVEQQLVHAAHAVRAGESTSANITTPAVGAQPARVVGEWSFSDD
jgi:hypothetical protein